MNKYRSGFGCLWRVDAASFVALAATGIMAFSVVTLTPTLSLGEERRVRPNPQRMLEELSTRLQLSESQKLEIKPILDEEISQRREVMDRLRLDLDRIDQDTSERLGKVLNSEQMAQYDELLKEHRSRGAERRLPPPDREGLPPRPPQDGN